MRVRGWQAAHPSARERRMEKFQLETEKLLNVQVDNGDQQ
jgi:hypothetical protein